MQKTAVALQAEGKKTKLTPAQALGKVLAEMELGGGKAHPTYFQDIEAIANRVLMGAPKIKMRDSISFEKNGSVTITRVIVSKRMKVMKKETAEKRYAKGKIKRRKIKQKFDDLESAISGMLQQIEGNRNTKEEIEKFTKKSEELRGMLVDGPARAEETSRVVGEMKKLISEISNREQILKLLGRWKLEEAIQLLKDGNTSAACTKFVAFENRANRYTQHVNKEMTKAKGNLRYLSLIWQKELDSHLGAMVMIKRVSAQVRSASNGVGLRKGHAYGLAEMLRTSAKELFRARPEAKCARKLMFQAATDLGEMYETPKELVKLCETAKGFLKFQPVFGAATLNYVDEAMKAVPALRIKDALEKLESARGLLFKLRIKVERRAMERHTGEQMQLGI